MCKKLHEGRFEESSGDHMNLLGVAAITQKRRLEERFVGGRDNT